MPKFIELTVLNTVGEVKEQHVFNLAAVSDLIPKRGHLGVAEGPTIEWTELHTFDDRTYFIKEPVEAIFASTELRQWTVI